MFAKKEFFFKGYPVHNKSNCDEDLSNFINDFGTPDEMTMNGSKNQTGRNSNFNKLLKNHNIPSRIFEPDSPNNNPVERSIIKVRKLWH